MGYNVGYRGLKWGKVEIEHLFYQLRWEKLSHPTQGYLTYVFR